MPIIKPILRFNAIFCFFLHTSIWTLGHTMYSQKISGVVVDKMENPVQHASVVLFPAKAYTVTDADGAFSITLPTGNKFEFVEVAHISYKTERIEASNITDFGYLKVVLTEAVTDLDEVVLVQSRILQKAVEKSQSVISLDRNFIERNNTGTFSGALAAAPGVNTMNVGVGIAKPMIRGMGFNRILVNNRGIKQEGQQWGADHGLEVDPFDVEEVEIIKGAASLLFGSDGLGGVINIKENSVLSADGNFLQFNTAYQTNNGAISSSVAYKGKKNNWFYSARITHQDYGDYTVPTNEFTYAGFNLPIFDNRLKNTSGQELHYTGKIGLRAKDITTSLRFSSFNQKAGIFTGAIGLPRAYNLQHNGNFRDIEVPRQENHHHTLTSNTTIALGEDRIEVDLGYQRNIREELSFPGAHGISPELAGSNLALGLYLDTYTANLRYAWNPNEDHQLLFGSQFQYMRNQKDGFEFLLPVFETFQAGFFHYQSIDLSDVWLLNGGVRVDFGAHGIEQHLQPLFDRGTLMPTGEFEERTPAFERRFENVSGALGTVYRLNRKNHLKLNLGNSFRFPTAIELSSNGVHHGNFRHERGDTDLGIERGYQADVTFLHHSEKLFLELATFYGYYTDYIYLAPTGNFSPLASGGTLWQYRQDDAIFNGFEVTARYKFTSRLQADLGMDFVQNLNLNSRLPLPLTPQPAILAGLEFGLFPRSRKIRDTYFLLSGRYNFEQDRTDRNERDTPGSFVLTVGGGFLFRAFGQDLQLRLTANNLLNEDYFNHISRYRLLNLPEQGRNFMISLKMPLTI